MSGDGEEKKTGEGLSSTRRGIQQAIERAEAEHFRMLRDRRVDLARQGVKHYRARQIPQALKCFYTYLRILEEIKQVAPGGLMPTNFDPKADNAELLLITGVYWDLAKIFDRSRDSGERSAAQEMTRYLQKFVAFSKGMPYQTLSAETMRKYISNDKAKHRQDFKNAYKLLGGSNCFVASALMDVGHPDTVPRLRDFRARALMGTRWGRRAARAYYRRAPGWAQRLEAAPACLRWSVARALDVFGGVWALVAGDASDS